MHNQSSISRRHRHRYEFNTIYKPVLKNSDLILSGFSDNNLRMIGFISMIIGLVLLFFVRG